MEITSHSTLETEGLAKQLASKIKAGSVIALYGELGAGKTTFTRYLVQSLGSTTRVQSPTFVIARRYMVKDSPIGIETINHLDLYRLKDLQEVLDLDLHQFITDGKAVTLIEWPEIAENVLPTKTIKIKFTNLDENTRQIYVENLY
jgi:tRNA threonylcarbamoyladenosine biosynthesis protein TsaE